MCVLFCNQIPYNSTEVFYHLTNVKMSFRHDIVPIVMGAPKEDYERAAPHNSFIHVDDFASPRALAAYLHLIDQNDHLYNDFFHWKGTGTFINTYFWCRVCAMLHDESRDQNSYGDLERWWRGNGVCIGRSSWKRHTLAPYISDYYSHLQKGN